MTEQAKTDQLIYSFQFFSVYDVFDTFWQHSNILLTIHYFSPYYVLMRHVKWRNCKMILSSCNIKTRCFCGETARRSTLFRKVVVMLFYHFDYYSLMACGLYNYYSIFSITTYLKIKSLCDNMWAWTVVDLLGYHSYDFLDVDNCLLANNSIFGSFECRKAWNEWNNTESLSMTMALSSVE